MATGHVEEVTNWLELGKIVKMEVTTEEAVRIEEEEKMREEADREVERIVTQAQQRKQQIVKGR